MPKKFLDVSGRVFGRLTVLHCNLEPPKRALVQCTCGKEFAVGIGSLTRGRTSSCGATLCSTRARNLIGQRFGHLFVKELSKSRNKRGDLFWICECDCGTVKRIKGNHLTPGSVDNCGCQTSIRRSERMRKPIRESFAGQQYRAYQHGARLRQLEFSLSQDEFENMIFSQCEYCGVMPYATHVRFFIDGSSDSIEWNGIDRVDSTKGYTQDNCVPCCKLCNMAKSDLSLNEFTVWISRLTQNFLK